MTSSADIAKIAAAQAALDRVEPDMRLGLGTGSTAFHLVRLLAQKVRETGMRIACAATSQVTADQALGEGLDLRDLDAFEGLDLTIDGADEIGPELMLIKGGGGALLREKIVASASLDMLVIADASKKVETLGKFPLPVELVQFGWQSVAREVGAVLAEQGHGGARMELRGGATPFVTDEGHYILDLHLDAIPTPRTLALMLDTVPGVVETGFFIDMAGAAIIGHEDGRAELLELAP